MSIFAMSTMSIVTVVTLFNGALFLALGLYLHAHRRARPICR